MTVMIAAFVGAAFGVLLAKAISFALKKYAVIRR